MIIVVYCFFFFFISICKTYYFLLFFNSSYKCKYIWKQLLLQVKKSFICKKYFEFKAKKNESISCLANNFIFVSFKLKK